MSETARTTGHDETAPVERRLWALWVRQADAVARATPVGNDDAYARTLDLLADQAAAWGAGKVALVAGRAGALTGTEERKTALGAMRIAARIDRRRALGL